VVPRKKTIGTEILMLPRQAEGKISISTTRRYNKKNTFRGLMKETLIRCKKKGANLPSTREEERAKGGRRQLLMNRKWERPHLGVFRTEKMVSSTEKSVFFTLTHLQRRAGGAYQGKTFGDRSQPSSSSLRKRTPQQGVGLRLYKKRTARKHPQERGRRLNSKKTLWSGEGGEVAITQARLHLEKLSTRKKTRDCKERREIQRDHLMRFGKGGGHEASVSGQHPHMLKKRGNDRKGGLC